MIKTIVKITGKSPYCQSKHHDTPKLDKEGYEEHEKRTWRERMHVNEKGNVVIPALAIKNCLSEAAKFLSVQIAGKGKATYTKHFEAGVLVVDNSDLGIKKADVNSQSMFVPSSGRRGDGKRVTKYFPVMPQWGCTAEIFILDETITKDVFLKHIEEAGKFIGLGSFRPRNNSIFGRFDVELKSWEKVS